MRVVERPETFVALRARHEAFQIATAVARGNGVDLERLNCRACGADIDWRLANEQICVDCPACGAVNELPCHLRYRVPRNEDEVGTIDYASAVTERSAWPNILPVADIVDSVGIVPAQESPGWLKAFCLVCLMIVLTSLFLMAFFAYVKH